MLTVCAIPELLPMLREKLQRRLSEIADGAGAQWLAPASTADAEDALRQLMVQYRPRVSRQAMAKTNLPKVLDAAATVASAVSWQDLRFIDAMNAVYEAWPAHYEAEARNAFVSAYRHALSSLVLP